MDGKGGSLKAEATTGSPDCSTGISDLGTGDWGTTQQPMVQQPIVQVRGLGKRYGQFTALDDCSLEIQRGEIFGLLGPNGAGKTTLLRCLLGFIRPTSGQATLGGHDCWNQRTLAHQQLTYMPAQPQLPRLMRARDVLRFFAEIRPPATRLASPQAGPEAVGQGAVGRSERPPAGAAEQRRAAAERFERASQLAERLQLDLNRWVALMSTGMRQKLAIAATLCAKVPLVFLDEPTANLDPDVRSQLLQELAVLRDEGTTVVFSSHVLSEIEEVCDRVAVLAKGRLVGLSSLAELRQGSVLTGRFLGPPPTLPCDPAVDSSQEWTDGQRFKWRTYRPLESLLPDLLAAGVRDLKIQTMGLLDVYHQHLAYQPPGSTASLAPSSLLRPTSSPATSSSASLASSASPSSLSKSAAGESTSGVQASE